MAYKILSLDGGGSWALVQAMCLANMYGEDTRGRDILKKFDLVIANSGGALALAAMAENYRMIEVIDLFRTASKRNQVFAPISKKDRADYFIMGNLKATRVLAECDSIGPHYSSKGKLDGLKALLPVMSNTLLNALPALINPEAPEKTQFVICNYDYDRKREVFQRSNEQSLAGSDSIKHRLGLPQSGVYNRLTVAEAVHAASNAPVNYFDQPASFAYRNKPTVNRRFWDGAVGGFNNPVAAGVLEALINKQKHNEVQVLSIGTANTMRPLNIPGDPQAGDPRLLEPYEKPGFLVDTMKMAQSIIDDPPDSATFIAYSTLYPEIAPQRAGFVRMNPSLQPVWSQSELVWKQPKGYTSVNEFVAIADMPMDATSESDMAKIYDMTRKWMTDQVPNQGIRSDEKLNCILGHARYSDARKAWRDCDPSVINV